MSDREPQRPLDQQEDGPDHGPRSINLWVVYGLMFLGFLLALAVAAMIVLPFYERR